jgi:hypothetical protein
MLDYSSEKYLRQQSAADYHRLPRLYSTSPAHTADSWNNF